MNKKTFLDTLADAITSPTVALHEFLLELKIQNKIIHAFLEGKTDESFYGSFIRRIKDDDYELKTYTCGNKDGVYYQFDQLCNRKTGNNIVLYFVDKDIEDIIPYPRNKDPKIFVTDCYSVENYIVNNEILEQVWGEIFRQRSGNEASKLILAKFTSCSNEFHRLMLTIMAWVLYHRRDIEQKNNKINLDCIQLKKIYKVNEDLEFELLIKDDGIVRLLDEQTKCNTNYALWHKHIDALIGELEGYPALHYVRGHNEMEFFVYFINMVKNALNKAVGKAQKIHVELTDANAIDVLGPRVQIPNNLEEFLYKNIRPQLALGI
jgi:Protein of unknown function (DUF4435)